MALADTDRAGPTDDDFVAALQGGNPPAKKSVRALSDDDFERALHADPIQANPQRPEDLPSREAFEASHRAAVSSALDPGFNDPHVSELWDPVQKRIVRHSDPGDDHPGETADQFADRVSKQLNGPGMGPAPAPSFWDRIKQTILGNPNAPAGQTDTPIGRAFGLSYEAPTEQHTGSADLPLTRPTALAPQNPTSVAGGVAKGAAQFAEGMTTAPNLLMVAGSGGLGILGKVSTYLPRAVSAGFSLDMLKNAYQQIPEVRAAIERKDWPAAATAITKAGLTAGMGVAAGAHAVRGGGVAETGTPEGETKPAIPGTPAARAVESARAGAAALSDTDFEDALKPEVALSDQSFKDALADNPNRRVTGSSNIPLNDQGRVQAQTLARNTAGQFDRIEHSPMDRAAETAQIVGATNPQAQLTPAEGLSPWDLGAHEGQPVETEKGAINERIRNAPDEAPPGRGEHSTDDAEPFNEFRDRAVGHLQDQVLDLKPGEKVLNITHGRDLRLIDSWLKNGAPEDKSVDVDNMTRQGDWSGTGDLFRVQEKGLVPVENAQEPGIYYARHGATDWNMEAPGGGLERAAETQTSPPRPDAAKTANNISTESGTAAQPVESAGVEGESVNAKRVLAFEPGEPLPGTVRQMPTDQIHADPVRFQFKANVGQKGVGDEFKGVTRFDPEKSGILSVWHDPADGKTYVVNGHHRLEMAQRLEAPNVTVRYLDAANAQEARTKGALINIAEGRGDALDAAKVFRDSGLDEAGLQAEGVSLKGQKAAQGLALANLDPHLFSQVVSGDFPVERAALIGKGLQSHEDQRALVDLLDRSEKGGKRITNDQVGEMIRLAKAPDTRPPTTTESQDSLFGSQETTRSLIREKAEVSEYVQRRMQQEKKLFEAVGSESAAARLGESGNVIKAGENAQQAERTGQAQALYQKLSTVTGPVNDALDVAASGLAKGEDAGKLKELAYGEIKKQLLDQAARLTGTGEASAERPQGDVAQGLLGLGAGKRGERGAIDPNLLTLGAHEFVKQDVIPVVKRVATDLVEAKDQALRLIAPDLRGEAAEYTGLSLRQRMAQFARRYDQGAERLKAARDFFNKRTPEDNYKFIDDIEHNRPTGDANLDAIAGTFRRMLDQRRREVQSLGEGELERFYQNYFPHIFERPEQAGSFMQSFFGDRRKMEGPKSFLKHREFPTFKEALDAGQKPVSDNPVELVMMKVREMDRYLLAHNVLRDLADRGIAKRVTGQQEERKSGQAVLRRPEDVQTKEDLPPNYISIRDPIGGGKWYAEQGAADVLNNYLTPGLRAKSGAYRIAVGINNTMNQANLGLSAFHLTGEVIRSGVSRAALGIEDLIHGKPVRGSLRIASAPAGPFLDYVRGSKVLRDWFKPGSEGAPIAAITDGLMAGGGRVRMDEAFRTGATESMMKALREGNFPGALIRAPWALLEKVSHPMMENMIPRLKLGVFHGMAADAIERLGPGADVETVRKAMAPIWDSVDNRMGQVVYDNLFWNRTMKDLSHLLVRSVGWNLGTIREIGGGALALKNPLKWRNPEVMHKVAYTLALPLVSGMIGALYQYGHTGKGPQELKDYFFPKRENGQRIALPTDVKDVYHYATDPVRTIENKTSPLVNTTVEMLHNKDFYDRPIRNAEDPFMKQLQQEADFIGRQFMPFTLQPQMGKKQPEETNPEHQVENYLGFTKAPADVQGGKKRKPVKSPYATKGLVDNLLNAGRGH